MALYGVFHFRLNIFHLWLNFLGCSQYLFQKQPSGGVLEKKAFLKISQNLQENTYVRVSFLNKVAGLRLAQNIGLLKQAKFLTYIQKK